MSDTFYIYIGYAYSGINNQQMHAMRSYYKGYEELMKSKVVLFGGSHKQIHPHGKYDYQFEFHLPENLPSTVEGPHGLICYELEGICNDPKRRIEQTRI